MYIIIDNHGVVTELNVTGEETIQEIKTVYCDVRRLGFVPSNVELYYRRQRLEDHYRVSEYNIQDGDSLKCYIYVHFIVSDVEQNGPLM